MTGQPDPVESRPADDVELVVALVSLADALDFFRAEFGSRWGFGRAEIVTMTMLLESSEFTPGAVADKLRMTSGAVTALLDRLEASGHLVRSPNPGDRRSTKLALTSGGASLSRLLRDGLAARVSAGLVGMTASEVRALVAVASNVSAALGERPDPA